VTRSVVRRPIAEFAGLSGYNFLAMVRRGFFYTFLMLYLREKMEMSVTFISLVGALNATAGMAGQILVWGRLSDRTDRRAGLMALGELLAGLGYLATFLVFRAVLGAWSPVLGMLLVFACLGTLELFWSMTDVGFRAALTQVTTEKSRGRYVGSLDLIGLVGVGLGLVLGGLLYRDGVGLVDGSLWFLAAGFILAGVPLIRFTLWHLDGVSGPSETTSTRRPLDRDFVRYMKALSVAVIGIWCFQHVHTFFIRLDSTAAASDLAVSHVRTTFWVVAGLAAPLAGYVMDRLGSRRTYAWSVLGCALVPLLFISTQSVLYAAVTLAAFGVFLTAMRTASYGLAAELAPEDARGRHFAVYNAVMSLGWGAAGLLVGGPVVDLLVASGQTKFTAYAATFVVGCIMGLVGLVLFLMLAHRGLGADRTSRLGIGGSESEGVN
jgi:MFS family permease